VQDKTRSTNRDVAEAHLAAIVSSSDDAIVSKTLDGNITSWNRGAELMFGFPANQAIGQPITIIIPPDRRDEETQIIESIRRGEQVNHYETVRCRQDGRRVDVSVTISPIRDSQGRIIGASKIARDISDRKQGASAKRLLAAIIESSDDAIISKAVDGTVTSWNAAAERLFGYTAAEAIGRRITDLIIPPERLIEENEMLDRLRKGERIQPFETVRLRHDGRRVEVSITNSPICDETGAFVGASKIVRDITAQKNAQRELARIAERLRETQVQLEKHAENLEKTVAERTAELRAMVADLEAFSYSISHDLRAPLRAMQGFAQLLHETHGSVLNEEGRSWLCKIMRAGTRLNKLIEDVLSYSRISRANIALQSNSLDDLVTRVIEEYPNILQAEPEITVDRPLQPVMGSETLLIQCIANLLGNAVKFVAPGVRPRIHVRTESRNGNIRLWVEDNGIGIPESDQHDVFGLFARGATKPEIEGSGVGLAVVQRAVARMHGSAGVESQVGQGSRFWIDLPAA
jgi:PAS domain S-box-containing protein